MRALSLAFPAEEANGPERFSTLPEVTQLASREA